MLARYVGLASESMIALEELEETEHKYDLSAHEKCLGVIAEKWPEIQQILSELPRSRDIEQLMRRLGMPTRLEEVGVRSEDIPTHVKCTKDIRKKYVGSWLLWDTGLLDDIVGI